MSTLTDRLLPGPMLLMTVALLIVLGLVAAMNTQFTGLWQVIGLAVAGLALIDGIRVWRLAVLRVSRAVPGSLPLGVSLPVRLRLGNTSGQTVTAQVYDHFPDQVNAEQLPQTVKVPAFGHTELRYQVTPVERGTCSFAPAQVRRLSPFGFWWRDQRLGEASPVRIYPNFAAVSKYILLLTNARLQQMGIQHRRKRGEGSEFHQLREFRQGDSLRQVDWRATARMRKLISREYQEERDQNLVLLLDCGRRMRAQDDDLSHFDHALNAMLLLAYVALRQGDAVGLSTFGGVTCWVQPVRGVPMLNVLLNAVLELKPTAEAPDYSQAALNLMARQRKRAFVVVISNMRDEDASDLLPALHLMRRKHQVVLASLREAVLDQVLKRPVTTFDDALRLAGTHDYLAERRRALEALRANGIGCLDVRPDELSVALVNQYLDMKASGIL